MLRLVTIALACALLGCTRYEIVPLSPADCPPEVVVPLDSVLLTPGSADSLVGRLWNSSYNQSLVGARVELLSNGTRIGLTAADSAGTFGFARRRGVHVLRIRAIGFKVRNDTLALLEPGISRVVIPMEIRPLDGCPGFQAKRVRKPWWKFW
jgi:hypothetical protein